MPALTLGRIAKLYGMHRSSVYEAVAKGRVSARLDGNGRKVIELSEAIRVWGEASSNQTAKPDTRHQSSADQQHPDAHPTDTLQPLLEELRLLREEVAQLRQAMMLLEHKPATPAPEPEAASWAADLIDALRARST